MPSSSPTRNRSSSLPRSRIYHACQNCATSKVKCQNLDDRGCARCRRRKTDCSLAGLFGVEGEKRDVREVSPQLRQSRRTHTRESPAVRSTYTPFDIPDYDSHYNSHNQSLKMEEMRKRIDILETTCSTLVTLIPSQSVPACADITPSSIVDNAFPSSESFPLPQSTSTATSTFVEGFYIAHRPLDVTAFQKGFTMDPINVIFDERARCAVDLDGFPDIISRGWVSRSHVEASFQIFKHRFSLIAPLIPFLLTTRSLPSHPFVVLASLAFLPNTLPAAAVAMIEESVLYAMTGTSSIEVILALYILTFATVPLGSESHVPLTCLRVSAFAYSMGIDLGLNTKADVMLLAEDERENLTQPWASKHLEELTLWEAVKNRYCILQMESARCCTMPKLLSSQFPRHPSDHVNLCIDHLQRESTVIEVCRDFISAIAKAEVTILRQWPDIHSLLDKWSHVESRLNQITEDLDKSEWLLICSTAGIAYSLALRTVFVTFRPPSPIAPAILEEARSVTSAALIRASTTLLGQTMPLVMSQQDNSLPAFLLTTITICLATSRRIAILTRHTLPNPIFSDDQLLAAENFIARQPGLPGKVLREMWCSLEDCKPDGGRVEETSSLWREDGFHWDFLDFDALFPDGINLPASNESMLL
ncbi:uncharacterized protein IL334_003748 [Kwoniella shivajii]|uniref:Zn(2)-C6 fungal-type domain-containing protein n=1 Tax=Kwoniella shivajii TaxID=564305 RepID=A0ABZ1D045_9TREE|nr:hypothetical protein IL334_003748 [Kwoniella shivajii]